MSPENPPGSAIIHVNDKSLVDGFLLDNGDLYYVCRACGKNWKPHEAAREVPTTMEISAARELLVSMRRGLPAASRRAVRPGGRPG